MLYLLDFDGTIADTSPGVMKCTRHSLAALGYEIPPEDRLRLCLGPPINWALSNICGVRDEDVEKAIDLFRSEYSAGEMFNCHVFPGVRQLITGLRAAGHTVMIVSAKPEFFVRKIVDYLGITDLMDGFACAGMQETRVTKADNIRKAVQTAGFAGRENEVCMIGDRCYDIDAAKEAGVHSIGVLYGFGTRDELAKAGAEVIVGTVDELAAFVLPVQRPAMPAGNAVVPRRRGFWGKTWYIITPLLIFLALQLTVASVLSIIAGIMSIGSGMTGIVDAIFDITLPATLISSIAVVIVQYFFIRRDNKVMGRDTNKWPVWGHAAGIAGVVGAGILLNYIIGSTKLDEMFPAYNDLTQNIFEGKSTALLLAAICIFGPAAEELTFRGLIQRRAGRYMNPYLAILLTSLLFGAVHGNMVQFIYAVPLGFLLGLLYYKSGSIVTPMIAHMVSNLVSMFFLE